MATILVIEDDEILRESLLQVLSGENYLVQGAANGDFGKLFLTINLDWVLIQTR